MNIRNDQTPDDGRIMAKTRLVVTVGFCLSLLSCGIAPEPDPVLSKQIYEVVAADQVQVAIAWGGMAMVSIAGKPVFNLSEENRKALALKVANMLTAKYGDLETVMIVFSFKVANESRVASFTWKHKDGELIALVPNA